MERWIPQARRRLDLFGFADVVALVPGRQGTTYLQLTTAPHGRERLRKVLDCSNVKQVLLAGNHVEVWEWRKVRRNGRRVWDARRWVVSLERGKLRADESFPYSRLKPSS
ncbi:MAG: hypothetical protein JRI66_09140 [Deltaproteobacteria bacterium]|nr:hypothetical protein [Deltaproteobacteria bacterium]